MVDAAPRAVMWTVSQIAERDGVSKQAVSKHVGRLVESGLMVERDGAGRVSAVNVADYDRLRGIHDHPDKAQAPGRIAEAPNLITAEESYDEAARRQKWIQVEKERLQLEELKAVLVRHEIVRAAEMLCGEEIAAIIRRLPNQSDEMAAAVARDGTKGARLQYKKDVHRICIEISAALAKVAATRAAQATDEAVE
jgi:hypothetical protein